MGLGILEDRHLDQVPGTALVIEQGTETRASGRNVKYDKTGKIILVPQPSDDPNDPLNWSTRKRDTIILILSLQSILATALGSILAANTLTLALYYGRGFTETALLTGYFLCGVGVAGILFVASARVWGKRHLYLLGSVILVISTAWAGASNKNYASLLWARIFQGIAVAPFEALVNATVGDMYFVHERGMRMALSNMALFGGAFFSPILVGKITHTLGWQWTFFFVTIFSGVMLPIMILFVPETAYRRSDHLNTDLASKEDLTFAKEGSDRALSRDSPIIGSDSNSVRGHDAAEKETDNSPTSGTTTNMHDQENHSDNPVPQKESFLMSIRPFNGRKTDENFFKLLIRPFPLFLHPGIVWACLIQGTLIGWTVLIGVTLAIIFIGPPRFFNEVDTGYLYAGPFIGAIAGFIISGVLADWSATYMTRRNRGVYEPEFRIVLVLPQLILGAVGLYGFGITAAHPLSYHWSIPALFFAMEVAGMVVGAVASALYIVDAHRDLSVEAFTCLLIFKNLFSFGLTFKAYDWLLSLTVQTTFIMIASIQVGVCLLSIPMYVFGKRNRSFFHRHDLLAIFKVR